MSDAPKLSHTAAMILQAVAGGAVYGFSVMELTGLPSGTVYPALHRLERDGLICSSWEAPTAEAAAKRPLRKYYRLTQKGQATLLASQVRYPLLTKLVLLEKASEE